MPELKLDFKNVGGIRLMPLDTSSLFLPFGRPIADYVRGLAGNQNGTRTLLKQGSIEFLPRIRWTESTSGMLRTTGFGGSEREGIVESTTTAVAEPADPGVADFLPFTLPGPAAKGSIQARMSPAIAPEDLPISKPRMAALPLRPRMTFGPAPVAKAKPTPVPAPAPKPVAAPPAAKAGPAAVAPPKPSPSPAVKPVTPPPAPAKVSAPAPPPQPKPVTVIPPAPKPTLAPPPATRVTVPQTAAPVASAPAARAPEPAPVSIPKPVAAPPSPKISTPAAPAARTPELSPTVSTPSPTLKPAPQQTRPAPIAVPSPRVPEPAISTLEPIVAAPPQPAKAPTPTPVRPVTTIASPSKPPAPPMPAGRAPAPPSPMESAPPAEIVSREAPREREKEVAAPKPAPSTGMFGATNATYEPHLTMGSDAESNSFLSKIPMAVKIGLAVVLLIVACYFVFGKSGSTASSGGPAAVAVGEQGWSTEWASDTAGSRRGRQLTQYRPSVGMTDYQLQFVGQIESKALGWFFREADTKNYYGMKIENVRPGVMAITHFAVVEGRESSNSQKIVGIDARPGAAYHVKLDVTGPRFTLYIGGEPVDFWTDNRLKAGALGFMNERDERGATSSVQFSFANGAK
jgi:hypothetical protein